MSKAQKSMNVDTLNQETEKVKRKSFFDAHVTSKSLFMSFFHNWFLSHAFWHLYNPSSYPIKSYKRPYHLLISSSLRAFN